MENETENGKRNENEIENGKRNENETENGMENETDVNILNDNRHSCIKNYLNNKVT